MRKKLLSLALALILALSLMPSAFAAEGVGGFTDVPSGAWYTEELAYALEKGFVSGTSASSFSPDANVSRAQFVTMLGRMLDVNTADYTAKKFDDVDPSSWYGPYVSWAAEKGYVNGVSKTAFAPSNNITFEQMGAILSNYIDKSGVVLTPSSTFSGYADEASISRWAQTSMEVMAKYDLLPVNEAGNVRPTSPVIRSEAAVALVRLAKGDGKGGRPISNGTSTTTIEKEPVFTAEDAAKKIHDELWESGKLTSSMTEKDKALVYYIWMCQNCVYNDGVENSGRYTAYGALVNREAVCEGLSRGYLALLETEGIQCGFLSSEFHMWNLAVLDGKEYEIDVTFGVACSQNINGHYNAEGAERAFDKSFMDYDEWFTKWYGGYPSLDFTPQSN